MKKKEFKGIYVALITPYDENGKINYPCMRDLIEYAICGNVSGFFVVGTSSEVLLLSEEERKKTIDFVVKAVAGRAQVIAQVGYLSTRDAVSMAKYAYEAGVDAISAIPPVYFRYRKEEIVKYYRDVTAAADIPFFVYNIPACTGMDLLDAEYREIFSLPNVVGWKESSAHLDKMREFLKENPDKILLIGDDAHLTDALALGGKGAIGSTYNLIPAPFVRLCELAKKGDWNEAKTLQQDLNKGIELLSSFGGIPAVKAVLDGMGFPTNGSRKPFRTLSEAEKNAVREDFAPFLEKYKQ